MSYTPIAPVDKSVHGCLTGGFIFLEQSESSDLVVLRLILLLYCTASLTRRTSRTRRLH